MGDPPSFAPLQSLPSHSRLKDDHPQNDYLFNRSMRSRQLSRQLSPIAAIRINCLVFIRPTQLILYVRHIKGNHSLMRSKGPPSIGTTQPQNRHHRLDDVHMPRLPDPLEIIYGILCFGSDTCLRSLPVTK